MGKKKERIVKTVSNEELPISLTKVFNKKYYKIGDVFVQNSGDCYLINDSYYRFETGNVLWDYELKQYVLKNANLIEGVVNINPQGVVEFGYFTKNIYKNVEIILKGDIHKITALNEEIFKNNFSYREVINSGIFRHISEVRAWNFVYLDKEYFDNSSKFNLPYSCDDVLKDAVLIFENNKDFQIDKNILKLVEENPILKQFYFGYEFETTFGILPPRKLYSNGIIPLRDGSINGLEFATVPLNDAKGIQALKNTLCELTKRTDYDSSCSLHLHLSGFQRSVKNILALYYITCLIQDEFFEMFPLYKKYNFKIKNKNYSAPFNKNHLLFHNEVQNNNDLLNNFEELFNYLSGGVSFKSFNNDLNLVQRHPSDPNNQQKWNIKARYHIVNMIPLIFGNKKTIEFRIHTPTYDFNKVLFFTLLNMCVLNFTETHADRIVSLVKTNNINNNVRLDGIIKDCRQRGLISNKTESFLIKYINDRKKTFESIHRFSKDINVNEEKVECLYDILNNKSMFGEKFYHQDKSFFEKYANLVLDTEASLLSGMFTQTYGIKKDDLTGEITIIKKEKTDSDFPFPLNDSEELLETESQEHETEESMPF